MSEYSAEEVRNAARRTVGIVSAMLTSYAERIEADEMAADYPECSGDPASCPENEGFGCCKAHAEAITLHPPAQAAQPDPGWPAPFEVVQSWALANGYSGATDAEACKAYREAHPVEPVAQGEAVTEPVTDCNQLVDRMAFERWMVDVHSYPPGDLIWQEKRNCYADYGIHLAWQAWQEAAQPRCRS